MVKDAEAHAEEDKKRREETEARNTAEQLVYSTEKFLDGQRRQDPGRRPRRRSTRRSPTSRRPSRTTPAPRPRTSRPSRRSSSEESQKLGTAMYAAAAAEAGGCRRRRGRRGRQGGAGRRGAADDDVVDAEVVDDDEPRTRSDPARRRTATGPAEQRPTARRAGRPRQAAARPRDRPGARAQDAPRGEAEVADTRRRPRRRPRPGEPRPRPAEAPAAPAERRASARTPTLAAERLARPAAAAGRVRQLQAAGRPRPRRRPRRAPSAASLEALLPVLDDIHLARQHGDLEDGPFAAIADKLEATLAKFGLERFGEPGEAFDPTRARGADAHRRPSWPRAPTVDHRRPGAAARLPGRRAGAARGAGRRGRSAE